MTSQPRHRQIETSFGPWLEQLKAMPGDYRAIVDASEEELDLLDLHLKEASENCTKFEALIAEKKGLPCDLDEANKVILDKLAEVRAIHGLLGLGFKQSPGRSLEDVVVPALDARAARP